MSKANDRLHSINDKLKLIISIIDEFDGKITKILEDEKLYKPAVYMHLVE